MKGVSLHFLAGILIALIGCTDKTKLDLAEYYVKQKTIPTLNEWLLETCQPDTWCEPYSEAAIKECFGENFVFEDFVELSEPEIDILMDDVIFEIRVCAIQKVMTKYHQDLAEQSGTTRELRSGTVQSAPP